MQCFSLFGELKVIHEKDSSKPKSEQENIDNDIQYDGKSCVTSMKVIETNKVWIAHVYILNLLIFDE
jgi:hypothetical protein